MKRNKIFAVSGFTCLLSMTSRASIDYIYFDPGYRESSGQITVTYPNDSGGESSLSGMAMGEVIVEKVSTNELFSAFCLSPAGDLGYAAAAYNPITPEAAKYGLNPSTWSTTGGIENAIYIWNQHFTTLTNNTEGAALHLALWAALYNSSAVGNVTTSGRFSVSGAGFSPEIQAAFDADIAEINAAGQSAVESVFKQNPATILRPVDSSMQDLLIDPPPAVPEPSPPTSSPSSTPSVPSTPTSAPPLTLPQDSASTGDPPMVPEKSSFLTLAAFIAMTGGTWLRSRFRKRTPSLPRMPRRVCRRRVFPFE